MATYRVELFGWPRIVAGCRMVELELGEPVTLSDIVQALSKSYPALCESVIDPVQETLVEGYTFNLNERCFTRDMQMPVQPEDAILLLSGMAGG